MPEHVQLTVLPLTVDLDSAGLSSRFVATPG